MLNKGLKCISALSTSPITSLSVQEGCDLENGGCGGEGNVIGEGYVV
jgi:hypothetical protein